MFGSMSDPSPPSAFARTPPLRWQWSRFGELGVEALYEVLAARQEVFAVEQKCSFLDADGLDRHAWHLIAWDDRDAEPRLAAYLRVLDPGRKFAEPSIGRVLTLPPHRGTGLGRGLMKEGIARVRAAWPGWRIRVAAQQRLESFYASLAFRTIGEPYDEDGIPHIDMVLDAER
jgi:ElaA protein